MGVQNLLYLVFALALVNSVIGLVAISSFLSKKKSIATAADLAVFKALARRQMYQALLQIVFLGLAMLIGIYGIVTAKIPLLVVIILNALVFAMGMLAKGPENRARSLRVEDEALKSQYKRVCDSWVRKPFPDF